MNVRPGPADGFRPKEITGGITIKPARMQEMKAKTETQRAVVVRFSL